MLKAMRKHAKYFYVLFFFIIVSFIFWGVGNVDQPTATPVAEVEKDRISLEEYWTSYERARAFYKENFKDQFNEEMEKKLNLKQKVLDSLIDERVLVSAAKKAGINVTDEELTAAIINDPSFARDGRFSQEVYVRVLQLNRMTPESFETLRRRELVFSKMRRLIGESVDLTDADLRQVPGNEQAMAAIKQTILFDMRDKAVKSYIEGLKKDMKIKINQKILS